MKRDAKAGKSTEEGSDLHPPAPSSPDSLRSLPDGGTVGKTNHLEEGVLAPLPERVYRIRLCEQIFREVVSRGACRGGVCDVGEGVMEVSGVTERSPGRVVVDDMLLLKDQLPMPESEDHVELLEAEIRGVLERCESELVRGVPWGNLAHYMRMAYRASLRPYWPTLDELVLL